MPLPLRPPRVRPTSCFARFARTQVARGGLLLGVLAWAGGDGWAAEGAPSAAEPPPVSAKRAELWFGGDVHLGDGGKGALAALGPLVEGAAGIVNLEGPVAATRPAQGIGLKLHNAPSTLGELRVLGVAVAGISNNHAGDAGKGGPKATAAALREAGLLPAGGPAGVAVLERGGLRFAITAHDLTGGVPSSLKSDLFEARRRGDVLIATFHVTGPALYARRPELRQAVELALSAGARVVAAHGTHAVAAVERRGDAVIAWGLGNVAFACDCTDEADAVLMRVRFEGTSEGTKVAAVELLPIDAGLDGGPARPSEDAAGILALLRSIGSSPFRSEGGRGVLEGL